MDLAEDGVEWRSSVLVVLNLMAHLPPF